LDSQTLKYLIIGVLVLVVGYYFYLDWKKKQKKPQATGQEVKPPEKKKLFRKENIVLLVVVCALIGGGIYYYYNKDHKITSIPLSEAITLSQSDTFNKMVVETGNLQVNTLYLTVTDDITVKDIGDKDVLIKKDKVIIVNVGLLKINDLVEMGFILPADYSQKASSSNSWFDYIQPFIFIIAILIMYYILMNTSIMTSSANKYKKTKTSVTFADIGGLADVKDSFMEAVSFLKDWSYLESMGATIPRGILLTGEPGTGKTMLAQAVANEAKVPFFFASGSDFQSQWVSMAGQRIKKLFATANKSSPCVIFIDELDTIAQIRGDTGTSTVAREFNNTVNQLLAEMDGFKKNNKILVIAATNRIEALDPAVLRPGRFDRKIVISLPNFKDRIEIIKIHAKNKSLSSDVNIESIAKQTAGFSGADLALLLNESAIIAGREHKKIISNEHINKAIDKVTAGDERKLSLNETDKKLIAIHESGHALVASMLEDCDKVQRISILPHGQAGGFTRLSSDKDEILLSKTRALNTITTLLGGRMAEELFIGDISSSASNDLMKANSIARKMVENFGMGKEFGLRYSQDNQMGFKSVSNESSKLIDSDIQDILDQCNKKAREVLTDNRPKILKVVDRLLAVESLNADEFNKIIVS
jgi:cell division protease FtsH